MEMDMAGRRQYLKTIQTRYQKASKLQKTEILNEFISTTGLNRKYTISQLNDPELLTVIPKKYRGRSCSYDLSVVLKLKELWEIFDYPCGQRLYPLLQDEVDRLIRFGEISLSETIRSKLLKIKPATIDRKLKPYKANLHRKLFSTTKPGTLLKKQIAIRLTDWDLSRLGYTEVDLVAHNGGNPSGDYLYTLSLTELATGWWEGQVVMGKSSFKVFNGLINIQDRLFFKLKGLDSDNGSEFINDLLFKYCQTNDIEFTRGRPNKKNDNAYIEQKNWTHVRKALGYYRFDTQEELAAINDLYQNEYSIYKNFFQPTMRLESKVRISGNTKRRYEKIARTPYKRLLASDIPLETKHKLQSIYQESNPAELKRIIDKKLHRILAIYSSKTTKHERRYG